MFGIYRSYIDLNKKKRKKNSTIVYSQAQSSILIIEVTAIHADKIFSILLKRRGALFIFKDNDHSRGEESDKRSRLIRSRMKF